MDRIADFFFRAVNVTLTADVDQLVFWSAMGLAAVAVGLT